jgi:hypothetical protein
MKQTLLVTGLACIIGAIVGGGFKSFGIELPTVGSRKRQFMLGLLGVLLLGSGLAMDRPAAPKLLGTVWEGSRTYHNNNYKLAFRIEFAAGTATTFQSTGAVGRAQGVEGIRHYQCRWKLNDESLEIDCPADGTHIGMDPYHPSDRDRETLSLTVRGSSMTGSMTKPVEPELFMSSISLKRID